MKKIGKLLLAGICLLAAPLYAQDEDDPADVVRIPAVKPASDFYGAAGTGVKVEATATPLALTTDDWLKFTLKITNLLNAAEVEKPKLSGLKDFSSIFQVDDQQADPVWNPNAPSQRVFVYRFRPRSTHVDQIPPFRFIYFDPKRRFPPVTELKFAYPPLYTETISIKVLPPKTPPSAAPVPINVPPFAASTDGSDAILKRGLNGDWSLLGELLALLLPPVIVIGWVMIWKRKYPDAARLSRLMRSRAARNAWAALNRAADALGVAAAVLDYLHERYDLPRSTNTPAEIRAYLSGLHFDEDRQQEVEAFFLECDALRFAPASETSHEELARRAADTVAMLEDPA